MRRRSIAGAALTAVGAAVLVGVVAGGVVKPSAPSGPAASLSGPAAGLLGARTPGTVLRVVDGDTVHVATAQNPDLDVRIVGLNAPESVGSRPKGCGGQQASAFAKEAMAPGSSVTLVTDPRVRSSIKGANPPVDRYGRALALVELPDGKDYSLTAVRAGLAEFNDYGSRLTQQAQFEAAQRDAQGAREGIWGQTRGAPGEPNAGRPCTPETSYPGR